MLSQFISAKYADASFVDSNLLAAWQLKKPEINDQIIMALNTDQQGKLAGQGLITAMCGLNMSSKKDSTDTIGSNEYSWFIEETDKIKSVAIVKPPVGEGRNFQTFEITLAEDYFGVGDVIIFGDESQARVEERPLAVGNSWCYKLVLLGNNPNASISEWASQPGQMVGWLGNAFEEGSEGGSMKTSTPFGIRNQMNILRTSYAMTGSAKTDRLILRMAMGNKKYDLWLPKAQYDCFRQFNMAQEQMFYMSKSNRFHDSREVAHYGVSGRTLHMGSGLEEQISNINDVEVGELTEEVLRYMLLDLLRKSGSPENKNLMVFTGLGGIDSFDKAMRKSVKDLGNFVKSGDFFIGGERKKLSFGGQFVRYEGLMNTSFTICHHPFFDNDKIFTAKDPTTGFTLKSYDMHFVDFSVYSGTPNVQIKAKGVDGQNRYMLQWMVEGSTSAKMNIKDGISEAVSRASNFDGFTYNMLSERMLIVNNPLGCGRILRSRSSWS